MAKMLLPTTVTSRQARRLWQQHSLPECTAHRDTLVWYTPDMTSPNAQPFVVAAVDRRLNSMGWTTRELVWGAGAMDLPADPLTRDFLSMLSAWVSRGRDVVLAVKGSNFSVTYCPTIRAEEPSPWDA